MTRPLLTPEDHDNGYVDVTLEYKPTARKDLPPTLRITPVPSRRAQALMLEAFGKNEPVLFLTACVQPDFRGDDFLNRLTPECLGMLTDVAFEMIYGPGKKKALEEIGMKALHAMISRPGAEKESLSALDSIQPS
jgi:hypothetical protein